MAEASVNKAAPNSRRQSSLPLAEQDEAANAPPRRGGLFPFLPLRKKEPEPSKINGIGHSLAPSLARSSHPRSSPGHPGLPWLSEAPFLGKEGQTAQRLRLGATLPKSIRSFAEEEQQPADTQPFFSRLRKGCREL